MSEIRVLPPAVANRIAAGEVVERPASLAKELVENSLDAGATFVEVEFERGGIDLIRVSDDGRGIVAEDVRLAFERHATSKVWDPQDLVAIDTLGFRGEALASIASVARVELTTQPADGSRGTKIRLEAGEVVEEVPAARAPGTTIDIRDLFFNVPARRKFLKTPATEGRLLTRTIGQLALGAAGVGLRVIRDGKRVLEVGPRDDFATRVTALLGDVARRMVDVKGDRDGISVRGRVSPADFSRTRVNHQVLLVNGRPVVDSSLSHAVTAGIGGAAPGGKYPIFALAVTVDPSEVDVNVHPTKREVRFSQRDRIFSVIRHAVASSVFDTRFDQLGRETPLPGGARPGGAARVYGAGTRPTGSPASGSAAGPGPHPGADHGDDGRAPDAPEATPWIEGDPQESLEFTGELPPEPSGAEVPDGFPSPEDLPIEDAPESARVSTSLASGRLRLVGELWGAYLVVEDAGRALIIDQHAAHERVLYDEIREVANDPKKVAVQGLLVPLTIDLAPGHDPEEAAAHLREVGFDARPGGPNSILVDGVPGNLSRWGGGEFLRDVFSSAEAARAGAARRIDYLAKTYACKRAVKFGQRLHPEEIDHLLRSLERTEVPRLCPHGRPIYLEVPRHSLDDRFER